MNAGNPGLPDRFGAHIESSGLIERDAHILVAVSGGVDSVVMLHLLQASTPRFGWRLTVAHFDHAMRPGSAEDAAFVDQLSARLSLPCMVRRATESIRTENAAREARYRFLAGACTRAGASHIATGHHADDQAETILFRLIRGSGLAGMAGIPSRRGRIVRPMLPFRGDEIEAYALEADLAWREDPTNHDTAFAVRNRIRHEVIPALERARPGATRAILEFSREAAAAESAWMRVIDDVEQSVAIRSPDGAFQLARDSLLRYHPHVRARVIRRILGRFGPMPGRAATEAALDFVRRAASGAILELRGGLRLERHFDRLVIRPAPEPPSADRPLVIREPRGGRGEATIGGRRLRIEWSLGDDANSNGAECFDPTALRFPLELRAWRPGDRIRTNAGTRKLKKMFGERRVARPDRKRTPVLVQDDGRVLWVIGLARAKAAEPAPGDPVFQISVTDAELH
jgi:tRNA(Ile)-lysidine synthase